MLKLKLMQRSTAFGWIVPLGFIVGVVLLAWTVSHETPSTTLAKLVAHQQAQLQNKMTEQSLCRAVAVCKKYDALRLECAYAENPSRCLRIKMGADADFSGTCSGYTEGAPALPPPPQTPNVFSCFMITKFQAENRTTATNAGPNGLLRQ